MTVGMNPNSAWDKQLEELRRSVQRRRFWQDVEAQGVEPEVPEEKPEKSAASAHASFANCCTDNIVQAGAICARTSNPGKALEWNHLRGSKVGASGKEAEEDPRRQKTWKKSSRAGTFVRWWKFNFVGGIGIAVQFAALFLLNSVFHLNYLAATALAVEIAVLHNFCWHERFTWVDRLRPGTKDKGNGWLARLARFHLANGTVSIFGNLALMRIMVGEGHMNYLAANAIAIVLCSLANFLVSDRWVFEG